MYLVGVIQSFIIVLLSAIFNIYIMYCNQNYDINAIVFTMFCVLATSWSLLLFSGPGKLGAETVFNFRTWIQALSLLINMILAIYLIKYVSGAEVAVLRRMSVPLSIILAFVIFKRSPKLIDCLNFTVLLASCLIIIFIQTESMPYVLFLTMLAAFTQCTSFMLAETHKQSVIAQKGTDLKDKARVVSFANFVSTIVFLAFLIICSVLLEQFPILDSKYLSFIPNTNDYLHLPSIVSGLIFGFIASPFLRYFIWSASYKIKSENVLAILALIPISTFILQSLFEYLGVIRVDYDVFSTNYSLLVFAITIVMTISALFTTYVKNYQKAISVDGNNIFEKIKNSIKAESQSAHIGMQTNTIADSQVIKNTVEFYDGDTLKAANILQIPEETVKTIMLTGSTYTLRDDVSARVHDIFRNKIFYLDQLTGIENKKGLIRKFNELKNKHEVDFNLYYIDINKFKHINDTYGHNIGDIVIIETINRINEYAEQHDGFAYRLSGDEFAMISLSLTPDDIIINDLKELACKPIEFNKDEISTFITISISIGKANIIKDEDVKIKDIIDSADENMYKDKQTI